MESARNNGQQPPEPYALDMPHALDAERAVLGSMLLDERAIAEAIPLLPDGAAEFWGDSHRQLYTQIVALYDQRQRADDPVIIRDVLSRGGLFEAIGGYDFLAGLIDNVPSARHVEHYARIVHEKYLLRLLIDATDRVSKNAFADAEPVPRILERAAATITEITDRGVSCAAAIEATWAEQCEAVYADIERGVAPKGVPSGFADLDALQGGFVGGQLVIVGARTSHGKSAFAVAIAAAAARAEMRVAFCSLEMSAKDMHCRFLASRAQCNLKHLLRDPTKLTGTDQLNLSSARREIQTWKMNMLSDGSLTPRAIRGYAKMLMHGGGLDLLVVDYLQIVVPDRRREQRYMEVGDIARSLKRIAMEFGVPLVAPCQLGRSAATADRAPTMKDLRESGDLEQEADVVILVYRPNQAAAAEAAFRRTTPAPDQQDDIANVILDKNRNGPCGVVTLRWIGYAARFDNWTDRPPQQAEASQIVRPGKLWDPAGGAGGEGVPF